jgi:hypothetical protein
MRSISVLCFLALLLQACGGSDKVCDPGDQKACACVGGGEGAQVCLQDGSGWGECDCGCVKDCTGRECGPDPVCGEDCGSCPQYWTCLNALGVCSGCTMDQDCILQYGEDYVCITATGVCIEYCEPDCSGKCCGDDGCGNECQDTCLPPATCNTTTCQCEGDPDCCPDAPQGEFHIEISGHTKNVLGSSQDTVGVAAVSPMEFLTVANPTRLAETTTAMNDGEFTLGCFDVTDVALGIVVMADDTEWDGGAGDYFPTGTAVVDWETNEDKVCLEHADVFVLNALAVAFFDNLPDIDSAADGFVMGMVVDTAGNPVAGATIEKADGSGMDSVYYPSVDFADMESGSSTSNNGIFILPALNFTTGIVHLTGDKSGMNFDTTTAASKPGSCFFVLIREST